MASPRFLIAKYIRDTRRMEPRNIGVVLWSPQGICSRFVGDADDGTAPTFMTRKNQSVYKRWVAYWRELIDSNHIPGRDVDNKSDAFLDALRATSKDNYVLTGGGRIPMASETLDLEGTTDLLFHEFVSVPKKKRSRTEAVKLDENWQSIVSEFGVAAGLTEGYSLTCNIKNVERHLKFSAAIGNGTPNALFQKALLSRAESINSTAFMLMLVTGGDKPILPSERCASVVYAPVEELEDDPEASEGLAVLENLSPVINVSNRAEACSRLAAIVNNIQLR